MLPHYFRIAAFIAASVAVVGCAPSSITAQAPTFEPKRLDRATVVLSFAGGSDSGLLSYNPNSELREQLRAAAGDALIRYAAYFDTVIEEPQQSPVSPALLQEAVTSYSELRSETKEAVRRNTPLTLSAPSPLLALSEATGAHRSIVLYATGWTKTTANRVLSTLALSNEPHSGIGIEATIYNAESAQVEWFGQHYADLNPAKPEEIEAVTAALVFELLTGRRVSAFSFLPWPEGDFVTVWPEEGGRVSGRIVRRDVFDVVLQQDGTEHRIPLSEVKRITQTSGSRIFPSPRHSSSWRQAF